MIPSKGNVMKTPLYSIKSYPSVYDPSEDSFLLLDALESVHHQLINLDPLFILELGSGSGIVSTFVSQLLHPLTPIIISTDINPEACKCTLNTSNLNSIKNIHVVNGPGLSFLVDSSQGTLLHLLLDYGNFDLIIFNPPYVVTSPEEISDFSRNWAGGIHGRQVIDEMIPVIVKLLSKKGQFLLITIKDNNNAELGQLMHSLGFNSKVILKLKAGIEGLSVTCFTRIL